MSTLEKLEKFQLENEKLEKVKGGNRGEIIEAGPTVTGGGSYVDENVPMQGVNTCVTYTSDLWDGSNPATMIRQGCTYSLEP